MQTFCLDDMFVKQMKWYVTKKKLYQSTGRCQVKLKQIGIIDYSSGKIVKEKCI